MQNIYISIISIIKRLLKLSQIDFLQLPTRSSQFRPLCNVEDFGNCIDCNLIFSPSLSY